MSRIGRSPVKLPVDVTVDISKVGEISVKGPEGVLSQSVDPAATIRVEGNVLELSRRSNQKSLQGVAWIVSCFDK